MIAEGPKPVEQPPLVVYEIHVYRDNRGRTVQESRAVAGSLDAPAMSAFAGKGNLQVTDQRTGQVGMVPLDFPIPGALSVEEAFGAFDGAARSAWEQVKAQARKPQIVVPGGPLPPGMRGGRE